MALNTPLVGNATAKDTIYTLTPTSASLLPKLLSIGIIGPIIFTQVGQQKKFNITQKPKNTAFQRMLDGNVIVYNTPVANWVGIEFTFSPASPTVQTLSNLAQFQDSVGPIVFSFNATSPTALTETSYPICVLTTPFSGYEENERIEDVVFEFAAIPPGLVNIGALTNAIGGLI